MKMQLLFPLSVLLKGKQWVMKDAGCMSQKGTDSATQCRGTSPDTFHQLLSCLSLVFPAQRWKASLHLLPLNVALFPQKGTENDDCSEISSAV